MKKAARGRQVPDVPGTTPMSKTVGVNAGIARPREPGLRAFGLVMLNLDGKPAAQLDTPKARQVGQWMLSASFSADSDAAAFSALVSQRGAQSETVMTMLRSFIQQRVAADRANVADPHTARERELLAALRENETARFLGYLDAFFRERLVPADERARILADVRVAAAQIATDTDQGPA